MEFGYQGELGPDHWGTLCPECYVADKGIAQSPIDLPLLDEKQLSRYAIFNQEGDLPYEEEKKESNDGSTSTAPIKQISLQLKSAPGSIVNDGKTIKVSAKGASVLTVNSRVYELAQFHFHSPAEHTINGVRHDLEMHFVHLPQKRQHGGIIAAVLGILFKVGTSPDPFISCLFQHIPDLTENIPKPLPGNVVFTQLQFDHHFFDYEGSLTTPPCSEGIHWCIMQKVLTITQEQLDIFREAVPFDNYRPTQPRNSRPVDLIHTQYSVHESAKGHQCCNN